MKREAMLCLVSTLVDLISAMSVNVPPPVEDEEQAPGRKHAFRSLPHHGNSPETERLASRTQRHQKSQELTLLPGTDAIASRAHQPPPTAPFRTQQRLRHLILKSHPSRSVFESIVSAVTGCSDSTVQ